ncbi:hypothetical protein NL676_037979 [Syzygium grande]|nr:hypothetical protein NL676_037979 [Syzygium grande]
MESVPNGINFAARLQQFEEMQRQHRMHAKSQLQSQFRNNSTSSKEMQKPEEPSRSMLDSNRPSSRSSSRRGPGQLQL